MAIKRIEAHVGAATVEPFDGHGALLERKVARRHFVLVERRLPVKLGGYVAPKSILNM